MSGGLIARAKNVEYCATWFAPSPGELPAWEFQSVTDYCAAMIAVGQCGVSSSNSTTCSKLSPRLQELSKDWGFLERGKALVRAINADIDKFVTPGLRPLPPEEFSIAEERLLYNTLYTEKANVLQRIPNACSNFKLRR